MVGNDNGQVSKPAGGSDQNESNAPFQRQLTQVIQRLTSQAYLFIIGIALIIVGTLTVARLSGIVSVSLYFVVVAAIVVLALAAMVLVELRSPPQPSRGTESDSGTTRDIARVQAEGASRAVQERSGKRTRPTPPTDTEREHLLRLLEIQENNLRILEDQQAYAGPNDQSVGLLNRIDLTRKEIRNIKDKIGMP